MPGQFTIWRMSHPVVVVVVVMVVVVMVVDYSVKLISNAAADTVEVVHEFSYWVIGQVHTYFRGFDMHLKLKPEHAAMASYQELKLS